MLLIIQVLFLNLNSISINSAPLLHVANKDITFINNFNDSVYTIVDKMPVFGRCNSVSNEKVRSKCSDDSFYKYLNENKIYTSEARKNKVKGNIVVQFVITSKGNIENLRFLRKLGYGIEEELDRIISIPYSKDFFWESGELKGQKVNVIKTYNIKFGSDDFGLITEPIPFKHDSLFTLHDVDELPVLKSCLSQNSSYLQQFCTKALFLDFVYRNLKFPREMRESINVGHAKVMFIISKEGKLSTYEIISYSHKGYNTAAKELFNQLVKVIPDWIPAKLNNQNVNMVMEIPIKFQNLGVINYGF